jgi:hypothetical protein
MKRQQRQQRLMSKTPSKQKKETLAIKKTKVGKNLIALHTKKNGLKNTAPRLQQEHTDDQKITKKGRGKIK